MSKKLVPLKFLMVIGLRLKIKAFCGQFTNQPRRPKRLGIFWACAFST